MNPPPDVNPPLPPPAPDRTIAYLIILGSMALASVGAVVVLDIFRPGSTSIQVLLGIVTTVIAVGMGLVQTRAVHIDVNSRMSAYLTAQGRAALGAGYAIGVATNAAVPSEVASGAAAVVAAGNKIAKEQGQAAQAAPLPATGPPTGADPPDAPPKPPT